LLRPGDFFHMVRALLPVMSALLLRFSCLLKMRNLGLAFAVLGCWAFSGGAEAFAAGFPRLRMTGSLNEHDSKLLFPCFVSLFWFDSGSGISSLFVAGVVFVNWVVFLLEFVLARRVVFVSGSVSAIFFLGFALWAISFGSMSS